MRGSCHHVQGHDFFRFKWCVHILKPLNLVWQSLFSYADWSASIFSRPSKSTPCTLSTSSPSLYITEVGNAFTKIIVSKKSSKSLSYTYPNGTEEDSDTVFNLGLLALQGPHHVAEKVTKHTGLSLMKSIKSFGDFSSTHVMFYSFGEVASEGMKSAMAT
mmetsp:Transcript_17818/g.24550  ORF Transcript_17818/g.24550 Transcript_17818/m.24550 type:complete len:160 (-) Transcript_17818:111-590(-)